MISARFDRQVVIEKNQKNINSVGTTTFEWNFLKEKFAGVDYRGGGMISSTFYGERVSTNCTFTIRYDEDVDYSCRIIYNNSIYQIEHIEIVGRKEAMVINTKMMEIDND